MRAMVLEEVGRPLRLVDRAMPEPRSGEVLIQVHCCGVCRTDLHVVDGELPETRPPIVPGHEIVGQVVAAGDAVEQWAAGDRVGVPWLASTCGTCAACKAGRENLCEQARFTGYHRDGGYQEFVLADARYVLPLPAGYSDAAAAPLLCAGLIGYRSLRKAGDARRLGLYGFGAAAHIVAQVARHQGREVFAFTRAGDTAAQAFARELGAAWAGASEEAPPEPLDAAIIFAPVGALVPQALRRIVPGGRVVCAGIHMSDIPGFPYADLWREREVVSVANLTRADGAEFMALAGAMRIDTATQPYALTDANAALEDLRHGRVRGAAILDAKR